MTADETSEAGAAGPVATASAGTLLAQARVQAGMSVDDIAMQLKLAPRQVVAIERDDFASLPGRTFVRGFVRNYARLLRLDVEAIVEALPGDGAIASLDRPSFPQASRAMGQLPSTQPARPGVARWAIPLVLMAIIAIAAVYEFARPPAPARSATTAESGQHAAPAATIVNAPAQPVAADNRPAQDPQPAAPAGATSALPNPLSSAPPVAATPPVSESPAASPATSPPVSAAPAPPVTSGTARNQLTLAFRGTSWIEVRDRSGNIVLSMTGNDGASRELVVAPPGEIIVGNVMAVDASWRGRPLELAPLARQNVARVRLD